MLDGLLSSPMLFGSTIAMEGLSAFDEKNALVTTPLLGSLLAVLMVLSLSTEGLSIRAMNDSNGLNCAFS